MSTVALNLYTIYPVPDFIIIDQVQSNIFVKLPVCIYDLVVHLLNVITFEAFQRR